MNEKRAFGHERNLEERLQRVLAEHHWQQQKILVAVSGGLDSMTLAALLRRLGVAIALAHCNFGLRGQASDDDEQLVRHWAARQDIPLYVQHFDTPAILQQQGGNLQDTARRLRYDWFETLRKESGFDRIAVAHHRQDSVETLLMNFFKGTGLSGMHGILPEQGRVIRPLLTFDKAELKAFALAHEIPWREDGSNAKDTYLRNRIRHHLLPQIEAVFPKVQEALEGNMQRMYEAEMLYRESVERYRRKLLEQRGGDYYIPVLKLAPCRPLHTIVYELLQPFGFSAAQLPDILHLLSAPSGKWVANGDYRVLRDRNFLIVTANDTQDSTFIRIEHKEERQELTFATQQLVLQPATGGVPDWKQLPEGEEIVVLRREDFPLILRPLRAGDYFYPIGMNHKKKKVGKFLRDLKVPLHEKEQVWVLESHRRMVWVLGFRIDERFKVRPSSHEDIWLLRLLQKRPVADR